MRRWFESIHADLSRRDYREAVWRALLPLGVAVAVINGIALMLALLAAPVYIIVVILT